MSRLPRVNSAGQYNFPKKLRAWDIDIFAEVCYDNPCLWGYSSAGRALEWHSRGQRFDPAYLHQKTLDFVRNRVFFLLFGLFCVRHFGLGQQMDNKRFTVSSFLTAERKNKWHLSKKNEQKTNIFHSRFVCVWVVMKAANKSLRLCVGIRPKE